MIPVLLQQCSVVLQLVEIPFRYQFYGKNVFNSRSGVKRFEPTQFFSKVTSSNCISRLQAVNYFRKNAPSQMFVLVLNTPLYYASNAFCGVPSLCMFVQRKPSKEFSNVIDIFVNRNSFQRFSSLKLSKLSFIFIMLTRPGYSRILATLQSFYNRVDVKLSYCMSTAVCRFSSLCITLQK